MDFFSILFSPRMRIVSPRMRIVHETAAAAEGDTLTLAGTRSKVRIGTRGSALALWQARWVQQKLAEAGVAAELEIIRTRGDAIQNVPLPQVGGKGLFTAEIEDALRDGRVDLAVHSLKDLPTDLPEGFALGAIPERADARDVLVAPEPVTVASLRRGAVVGTSSPRRAGQIRHWRPDLQVISLRGNVDTRIRKLLAGEADAILLAAAGVERLGLTANVREHIAPEVMCPCPGQGALGIECRAGDAETLAVLAPLDHAATRFAVEVERGVLAGLGGGCSIPLGVYCAPAGHDWRVWASVCRPDGSGAVRLEHSGRGMVEELAAEVSDLLRKQGAAELLEAR